MPGSSYNRSSQKILNFKEWFEGYYLEPASRVKACSRSPIIAVGGIRDLTMIETVLSQNTADLVAMSRPFIREPHLVRRWISGDLRPSQCISCNGCVSLVDNGQGPACACALKEKKL
jgi:2,4-dienoyl-CoA reductase-like NADH-dependent reductase (Old Yellow Enzyme family)